jgi:hypothetical protein
MEDLLFRKTGWCAGDESNEQAVDTSPVRQERAVSRVASGERKGAILKLNRCAFDREEKEPPPSRECFK